MEVVGWKRSSYPQRLEIGDGTRLSPSLGNGVYATQFKKAAAFEGQRPDELS